MSALVIEIKHFNVYIGIVAKFSEDISKYIYTYYNNVAMTA